MLLADMRSSDGGTVGQFFYRGDAMRDFNTLNAQHQKDLIRQAVQRGDRWAKRHGLVHLTGRSVKPINQGRNRPCPCGSGKKYKRCCLSLVLAEAESRRRAMFPVQTGKTLEAGGDCGPESEGVFDGGDCESPVSGTSNGEPVVRCGEAEVVQAADRGDTRAQASDAEVAVGFL